MQYAALQVALGNEPNPYQQRPNQPNQPIPEQHRPNQPHQPIPPQQRSNPPHQPFHPQPRPNPPQPSLNTPHPSPNTNSQPNPVNEQEEILLSDSESVHIDSMTDSESESDDNLEEGGDKGASHVEDSDRSGGDELLSDVNEDNISEDVVREIGSEEESDSNNTDQPFRGRAFRFGDDGKIHLEVDQLYRNMRHFRQVIFDYSVQEGFMLNRIKNESMRITCGCATQGCPWRVHGSPTYDRVTFMILHSIVLRTCSLDVPDHTLYKAKNYALCIGEKEHIRSYNMLYRYAEFEVLDDQRQLVVDLGKKICKCGFWAVSGYPCRHALACILKRRDSVEGYVHDYLKKTAYLRTYSHVLHPIPDENLWPQSDSQTVLPPIKNKRAGRPKKQRIRGATESRRVQRSIGFRCSKCKEVGHNSRTCQNRDQPAESKRKQVGSSSAGAATNSQASPPSSQMMPPNTGTVTSEGRYNVQYCYAVVVKDCKGLRFCSCVDFAVDVKILKD
ncbi:hypothetical protein JRO89_XS13G0233500 [Xanthoceras sorbifolium]|uniref:SWIM-type domain-containing protein n=1 Tax=Xanthoceras sorbifolium TaxID=99658 RepID=A0ABQ8H9N4_9ROSI|nr:hypothetical protein JRO89_XS13G0233500 [Xanthoceras sorbifolium]